MFEKELTIRRVSNRLTMYFSPVRRAHEQSQISITRHFRSIVLSFGYDQGLTCFSTIFVLEMARDMFLSTGFSFGRKHDAFLTCEQNVAYSLDLFLRQQDISPLVRIQSF